MITEAWAAAHQVASQAMVSGDLFLVPIQVKDALIALCTGILVYVSWSLRRGVKHIDDAFKEHKACINDLYEKHNKLALDFQHLKGEHSARYGRRSGEPNYEGD